MCIDARTALTWWTLDPLTLATLGATSALYTRGLTTLWRQTHVGAGISRAEAAAYYAGQLSLFFALVSPLDRLSDWLFSAHMVQHEVLLIIAPPLIAIGRPIVALYWAFGPRHRGRVARTLNSRALTRVWRFVSSPFVILLLHGVVVWLWHIPAWFEAALRSELVHAGQHLSFFLTGLIFWWAMLRGRYGRGGYGLAAAFVFATAMHTSVLGALLTVAARSWYPLYLARGKVWQIDGIADQQLAGLIMWVPAGVLLAMLSLGLFAAWLGEAARRASLGRRYTDC